MMFLTSVLEQTRQHKQLLIKVAQLQLAHGIYSMENLQSHITAQLAVVCFAVALLCGIMLTIFRPWALLLGIIGFLSGFFLCCSPHSTGIYWSGLGGNRYSHLLWHLTIGWLFLHTKRYSHIYRSTCFSPYRTLYNGSSLLPSLSTLACG